MKTKAKTKNAHLSSPYHRRKSLHAIKSADPVMNKLIQNVGRLKIEIDSSESPFSALSTSIVYQQLAGRAAAAIHGRVLGLFPKRKELYPEDILKAPLDLLRSAGLSGSKAAALKDLSVKTLEGIIPSAKDIHHLPDQELLDRITQVKGIGPWTVEMLLIFYLGRPDILPSTDYGVRKGFAETFRKKDLPTPKELLAYGERWRPYRSVASWYLWRSLDLSKKEKK